MKKIIGIISIISLILLLFFLFYFKKSSYEVKYQIKNINIKESYHKEDAYYLIELTYNNNDYAFLSFDDYTRERKLIKDINITYDNDLTCLELKSDYLKTYSLCHNGKELINYNNDINNNKEQSYANFSYYDLNDSAYLLWNYHNFVYLNNKNKKEIKLFDHDEYNLNLITTYNNYLIIGDKDNGYTFNKIYVINSQNGKLDTIDLRYNLYYNDTYFLGSYKHNLYLYDKKQEQEYYINMKKNKIYKTSNKVLINNEWQDISTYKLKNNNVSFQKDNVYNYEVINNNLYARYLNYKIKISDLNVKTIVKTNKLDVYFLVDDTLLYYNPYIGIKKIISYPEWNFNYQNMIYIFD